MDVCLVEKDHERLVALGARQHALELLDKGLPLLRVSPAQQLLGFRPRQLAPVQSSPDRLAEFGFAARAKKGRRPPVRRKARASGPWAL